MSRLGKEMPAEYSDRVDKLRQNRCETSFYKYGTAKDNFGEKLVNAIESHDMCVKKYLKTGNTEYLCDAAIKLVIESYRLVIEFSHKLLRRTEKYDLYR